MPIFLSIQKGGPPGGKAQEAWESKLAAAPGGASKYGYQLPVAKPATIVAIEITTPPHFTHSVS